MNATEPEQTDALQPPSRGSFLTLPVILVVGWIIYEVTHQPALAAMAMCLKFGWENFRTARWLLVQDPDRGRGRACFWLYVASGLWQVAVIGVAMVVMSVAVDQLIEAGRQGPGAQLDLQKLVSGAALSILFGFTFSAVATYIALAYSWRHGVRPWLNSSVHFARRNGEWPPLYGHRNRALVPVVSTLVITCFVLLPVFLIFLSILLAGVLPGNLLRGMAALGSVCCVFLLMPGLLIALQGLRNQRFFAEHPADCWGEEPLPEDRDRL